MAYKLENVISPRSEFASKVKFLRKITEPFHSQIYYQHFICIRHLLDNGDVAVKKK